MSNKKFFLQIAFLTVIHCSILKLFDNFDSLKNKIPQVKSNISWKFLLLKESLMKNYFLFSTKYLIVQFSCLAILTTLMFAKVYLNLLYFLPYFFKIFLPKPDHPLNIISCFFVNSQTMLRRVDLNISNNLYLMLNFFYHYPIKPCTACISSSQSFKGTMLITTSSFFWAVCLIRPRP